MNPALIIAILRTILCRPELKKWLENEAGKTGTPIDNVALMVIYLLLSCEK